MRPATATRRAAPRLLLAALALLLLRSSLPPLAAPGADPLTLAAQARELQFSGRWYEAVERWLGALEANPAFAEALSSLAACYLELEEYAQALEYVERAKPLKAGDAGLANVEGFALIGLGRTEEARGVFRATLARLPNDLEARFALALLDLRLGRSSDARARLEDALRIEPRNARALLSLALLALEGGRLSEASARSDESLRFHAEDPRSHYVAARVALAEGRREDALAAAETALELDPAYAEARSLSASLRFAAADFSGAASLMEAAIRADRGDELAWYALGRARAATGDSARALSAYAAAARLRPDDEITRLAAEDLIMSTLPLEDATRATWADWRFARAGERQLSREYDRAIAEFRRGLRVYPYAAAGRKAYAELLRLRGRNASYLAELDFLAELGKADRDTKDKTETWRSLLSDSVAFRWGIDQFALPKRPYRVALAVDSGSLVGPHPEAAQVVAAYLRSSLSASGRIAVDARTLSARSFAENWRAARELGVDYLAVLSFKESAREASLSLSLHVGRTGSLAGGFVSVRSGNDRVQRAVERVAFRLEEALAPRGTVLRRDRDRALVDLGALDGLAPGDILEVFRAGELGYPPSGLGLARPAGGPVATLTLGAVDEEVSEGLLTHVGFFDRTNLGDTVVRQEKPAEAAATAAPPAAAPEPPWTGLFEEVLGLR